MKTAFVVVGKEIRTVSVAEIETVRAENPDIVFLADNLKSLIKEFGPAPTDDELKTILEVNKKYCDKVSEINVKANETIRAIDAKRDEDIKNVKDETSAELLKALEARKAAELEKYSNTEAVDVDGNNYFIGYVKSSTGIKKVYISAVDLMAKKVATLLIKEEYKNNERTRYYNAADVLNYKAVVSALIA